MNRWYKNLYWTFMLFAAANLMTATAIAQAPILAGETLESTAISNFDANCDAPFIQARFDVIGVATGQVIGTFTEHVQIEPVFTDPADIEFNGFNANFIIQSADNTAPVRISGQKTGVHDPGTCSTTGSVTSISFKATGEYFSNIGDRGTFDAVATISRDLTTGTISGSFSQVFTSAVRSATPGQVIGGGNVIHTVRGTRNDSISFGFIAQSSSTGLSGQGNATDHFNQTELKLLDVTFLLISGTHATFSGNSECNGVQMGYRIDVDDFGEGGPNQPPDTIKIVTDDGARCFSILGPLSQGNIQIRQ